MRWPCHLGEGGNDDRCGGPPFLLRGAGCKDGHRSRLVNRVLTSPLLWYPVGNPAGGPAVHDVQDDPPIALFARPRVRLAFAVCAPP